MKHEQNGQGYYDNQSIEEVEEILEQIKAMKRLQLIGDRLMYGTEKYIVTIQKIK